MERVLDRPCRAGHGRGRDDYAPRAERLREGREVRDPERARQIAKVPEHLLPVGPSLDLAVLLLGHARGDEVLWLARLGDGDDASVLRAVERAGAVDGLAQHGLEVEARADAQQRLAQGGQACAVGRPVPGGGVGRAVIGWSLPWFGGLRG